MPRLKASLGWHSRPLRSPVSTQYSPLPRSPNRCFSTENSHLSLESQAQRVLSEIQGGDQETFFCACTCMKRVGKGAQDTKGVVPGRGRRVGSTRVEEGAGKEGATNYASFFACRSSNSECKVRKAEEGRKGGGEGRREEKRQEGILIIPGRHF